jgi:uncharacterized protein (DUF1501 family)
MTLSRRTFLRTAGATLAAAPLARALAQPGARTADEFFLFIHASGGWDVTLWADPRNERRGIVEPASTENTDTAPIRRWVGAPLEGEVQTFRPVTALGGKMIFGPTIGNLYDHADRLCVINGLAMNTVSHPDGTTFSVTGRHIQGSRSPQSSINTMLANEFGTGQVLPSVSVQFPSAFAGEERAALDRRAVPLVVDRIGSIGRTLARSSLYDSAADRQAVTALLEREATMLAEGAAYPEALEGMALQYRAMQRMLSDDLQEVFNDGRLRAAHPELNYKARFHGQTAVTAAFAVEAMRRNLVRCVSFALTGFDTHNNNYRTQALVQQDMFDLLAALIKTLDATPHPTRSGRKLGDHAHLLVLSDFCRTPQINVAGGRDHYPNNSALVISPRFRGGFTFGKSDLEQLLPATAGRFSDGERPIAPPDLLATFLAAFGVPKERYLRDGEVVPELLRA